MHSLIMAFTVSKNQSRNFLVLCLNIVTVRVINDYVSFNYNLYVKQKSWYLSGMSLRLPHEKKQPKTVTNSSLVGIYSTKSEDRVSFFLLQKKTNKKKHPLFVCLRYKSNLILIGLKVTFIYGPIKTGPIYLSSVEYIVGLHYNPTLYNAITHGSRLT